MITRELQAAQGDLSEALAKASEELIKASEPLSEASEEWLLPPGTLSITGPLVLGVAGVNLRVSGASDDRTTLRVRGGGLTFVGGQVELCGVRIEATDVDVAVALTGARIRARELTIRAQGADALTGMRCAARHDLELSNTQIEGVTGTRAAVGLELDSPVVTLRNLSLTGIRAAEVRGVRVSSTRRVLVTDVDVDGVQAGEWAIGVQLGPLSGEGFGSPKQVELSGVRLGTIVGRRAEGLVVAGAGKLALADVEIGQVDAQTRGAGIQVSAAEALHAVGLQVDEVSGERCEGIRLVSGGSAKVLDLRVDESRGTEWAHGLVLAAVQLVNLSGFTIRNVSGRHATGALIVGGEEVDVAVGTVERIHARGGSATGVRALPSPSEKSVRLRDLSIEAVWGAAPEQSARPDVSWESWRDHAVHELRLGVVGPTRLMPRDGAGVVGLHLGARVRPIDAVLEDHEPGGLYVEDSQIWRISGTALQLEGDLRPASLTRLSCWTSHRVGWVQAEHLLLAQLTMHRHEHGLEVGPGEIRLYDSVLSLIDAGDALVFDVDAEVVAARAVHTDIGVSPFLRLGTLPYRKSGPLTFPAALANGAFIPEASVDLRLDPTSVLVNAAIPIPGESGPAFIGAYPPEQAPSCDMHDPQPFDWAQSASATDSDPVINYLARDAPSLLDLMLQRARVTMPSWTDDGAADFTRMVFELLADRLDHLSLRQEIAVAEGFLDLARLRRSVEDHARVLDYEPDPGLSATAMLHFELDEKQLHAFAGSIAGERGSALDAKVTELFSDDSDGVLLPANTLVGNLPAEDSIIFATQDELRFYPRLTRVPLHMDIPVGASSAQLRGRYEELQVGRWLVLDQGPRLGGHVVRVTRVELSTHTTAVRWDPRRPAPRVFRVDETRVLGNVVPAHHGVPLVHLSDENGDSGLRRWRELLSFRLDGSEADELQLPFAPVSHQARGYPFPGEPPRLGAAQIQVAIEGDVWTLVNQLSTAGPGDEVFVLRSSQRGGACLRFGDGVNGQALPGRKLGREVEVQLNLSIGQGTQGNVGAHVLTCLIQLGQATRSAEGLESWLSASSDSADWLARIVKVSNPLPAVGGRDPEDTETLRYRAPFTVRNALSAITADDYVRALERLPTVAAARAVVVDAGVRSLVRVTTMLRDEDTLEAAERLRRWAEVRQTLEEVRLLGYDVETIPPIWVPLDLDLVVDVAPHARAAAIRDEVIEAIAGNGGLLDPDVSGLGGDVYLDSLYRRITAIEGVVSARVMRFRRLGRAEPDHLEDGLIPIGTHEVAVVRGPHRPTSDGILTVTACGGLR